MNVEQTLLIEIGTEDLPPTRLDRLGSNFQNEITSRLEKQKIPFSRAESFVSPRRIAVRLYDVPKLQPSFVTQRKGPKLSAAYKDDKPTKALIGFAKSCGTDIASLKTLETEQGAWVLFEEEVKGKPIDILIPDIVSESIQKLNYPKKMRWGDNSLAFLRPIHWITLVHGEVCIKANILGLTSSQYSHGHRTHFPDQIKINHADNYLNVLRDVKVIADYKERKEIITQTAEKLAQKVNGRVSIDEALLDQVIGLVEWPVPLLAEFSASFLKIPKEALISSMQNHQKCFPIFSNEALLPFFILVSNIEAQDPTNVIQGNERVMRARLEDAKFFFEQDSQKTLQERLDPLKNMIYQNRLGSLYQKSQRVSKLAGLIASKLECSSKEAERAGLLSKTDLVTNMVFEFPELQGIMGYYYALNDKEPEQVALAIKEAYLPSHAKDDLPSQPVGICLALAERLDTLVGIFGIGLIPTGEKDPYALRRAAMGILRILIEKELPFDLVSLLDLAHQGYGALIEKDVLHKLHKFCLERLKYWYLEQDVSAQVIDSVLSINAKDPFDIQNRIFAVHHFKSLNEAQSLAQANKRVKNILQKNNITLSLQHLPAVDAELLIETSEKDLFETIHQLQAKTHPLIIEGKYQEALTQLASLKQPVDSFFDSVLVMAEDENLKQNRISLLTHLYALFMQIADVSKLAITQE